MKGPREPLYLRMVGWLIRIPGMSLEQAKRDAKRWARNSPDPRLDEDLMREIERAHGGAEKPGG